MDESSIKGWCPGALQPMESGDGLIVRLKIGPSVPLPLAAKIASWSRRWGNGQIDLTSRANLQLRGTTAGGLPRLQDALADEGLLDADAGGEAIRNVISSPLAGIDPDALLDVRPLAQALERRLAGDPALHGLPSKFGFALDDGGRLGLGATQADVRFEATRTPAGAAFGIGLDGALDERLGPCAPDRLTDAAATLAHVFLDYRRAQGAGVRRMRDLTSMVAAEEISRLAGLAFVRAASVRARSTTPSALLGAQALDAAPDSRPGAPAPWKAFVGVGAPFGRMSADELADLVKSAEDHGARELRLTPWRAILIPLPSVALARELSARSAARPLILDAADPRRRVAACVGAPACFNATTHVRADAARLAALVAGAPGAEIVLHVSGCAKGCAHGRRAPFTFVGRDGRYDVVRDGAPRDAPLRRGLALDEAAKLLQDKLLQQTSADRPQPGPARSASN